MGPVIGLCEEKRGRQKSLQYLGGQVAISYELPLSEVVLDFFDRLKSVSRGYASFDYQFNRFEPGPFVRVDVLINGDRVDALSLIVHREQAQRRGRDLAVKMKELIPRQMFDVAIQSAIGAQVRELDTEQTDRYCRDKSGHLNRGRTAGRQRDAIQAEVHRARGGADEDLTDRSQGVGQLVVRRVYRRRKVDTEERRRVSIPQVKAELSRGLAECEGLIQWIEEGRRRAGRRAEESVSEVRAPVSTEIRGGTAAL